MEEIKVNDFVRTKNKGIQKIAYLRPNATVNKYAYFIGYDDDGDRLNGILKTTDIVKHSPNIIDLIEAGDYVNGYKVTNVINKEPCPSGKCVDIDADRPSEYCTLWEDDIETIVTKQQFENMEYKVEEQ